MLLAASRFTTLHYIGTCILYSWKFSSDKNFKVFEDFDVSLKVETSKFGFTIIFIGERACTSKIYLRKVGKR